MVSKSPLQGISSLIPGIKTENSSMENQTAWNKDASNKFTSVCNSSDKGYLVGGQGPVQFRGKTRVSTNTLASKISADSCDENRYSEIWVELCNKLGENANRNRLLTKMSRLPDEVGLLYDGLEALNEIKLDATARRMYYEEFCQKASGSDTLQSHEVEHLIKSKLGFKLKSDDLQAKTADFAELCNDGLLKSDGLYTFEVFVRLVLYILQRIKTEQDGKGRSASTEEKRLLPIDPESSLKQWWDILCSLLLLYCAFSVPYSIAFEEPIATLSPHDISDLVIDAIFMMDIALSFVTAYDDQGCFVKDLRKIRVRYLQTWFYPDVAGSFPFDIVITIALENSGPGSVSGLGSLKFIRMLRLIRAWKFMNRLKKLKDKDGYEAIGSAVTLGSALFLLVFSAHVLGCFITIIMQSEPDNNWLLHYNAELANGAIFNGDVLGHDHAHDNGLRRHRAGHECGADICDHGGSGWRCDPAGGGRRCRTTSRRSSAS